MITKQQKLKQMTIISHCIFHQEMLTFPQTEIPFGQYVGYISELISVKQQHSENKKSN